MKVILIPVLVLAALWNLVATAVGAIGVLGSDIPELAAAILLTLIVTAVLLSSRRIFDIRKEFRGRVLMFIWTVAILYGVYASWLGNSKYLIRESQFTALLMVAGLTFLCVAAPILLSSFLMRPREPVKPIPETVV